MNDDHVLGFGAGIIACHVVMVAICVVLLSMGYTEIDFILKQETNMPSPKTLEIQESKHVESKAHWFWISTKLELIDGRWVKSRGLTYRKEAK